MNCEEFRVLMVSPTEREDELSEHLNNCQSCNEWIEKELAQAPHGLTPAQWQSATARCFPEAVEFAKIKDNKTDGFWTFFINGLKYGMVFGLSIVTGFAILSLRDEVRPSYNLETHHEMSFLSDEQNGLPVFIEKTELDVTFLSIEDSELMSFVETSEMPNFIEENQEEEL